VHDLFLAGLQFGCAYLLDCIQVCEVGDFHGAGVDLVGGNQDARGAGDHALAAGQLCRHAELGEGLLLVGEAEPGQAGVVRVAGNGGCARALGKETQLRVDFVVGAVDVFAAEVELAAIEALLAVTMIQLQAVGLGEGG